MKVYLNNVDLSKLNIDYDSSYNQHFIYSNDGIFIFNHNKLYTVEIHNEDIEIVKFKDHEFLVDNSELKVGEIIYHLPFEHIFCNEIISKKHIGHGITFVRKVFFGQTCYYFEIEGKLESFMFSKMFTFII